MNWTAKTALALLFCGGATAFGAAQLDLGSADANAGGLAAVALTIQSDAPVAAFQADVVAGPGAADLSVSGVSGSHFAEIARIGTNTFRIVVYNLFNEPLANGQVLSLQARVSPSFANGMIALDLANVLLASPGAAQIQGVTASGGSIRVGGASAVRLDAVTLTPEGALRFEASGLAGATFVLEQSSDLRSWSESGTIAAQGSTATVIRNIPSGAGAQFFRVKRR